MPNRDGTGPYGDGRPGRGLGTCGFDSRKGLAARGQARAGSRMLLESGALALLCLIKHIINKKTNTKRS